MESLCNAIGEDSRGVMNEDHIIEKLSTALDAGGNINCIFLQKWGYRTYSGTILHYAIGNDFQLLVKYALSRGANIVTKMTEKGEHLRNLTALELAVPPSYKCREILTNLSLQMYSSYGLTPFHLECTRDLEYWKDEAKQSLHTADVNAAISIDSPIWPGMTPLLIAAKFERVTLLTHLLDLGADPAAQDSEGNTPLHYVPLSRDNFDERLFAEDGKNTFDSHTGESHFHLACRYCDDHLQSGLGIVQRYLDKGISPDLPIQSFGHDDNKNAGKVGLHIAVEISCLDLIQLLLEYGADVDEADSSGRTPIELLNGCNVPLYKYSECICLFMEAGLSFERFDADKWLGFIKNDNYSSSWPFLDCFIKLTMLNKNLVSEKLQGIWHEIADELNDNELDNTYADECGEERQALSKLGLLWILDNNAIIKRNFKHKLGWLDTFDFNSYPIYENLLKMRIKRFSVECEKKTMIIPEAIPRLQSMLQSQCLLPHLCAESILWNFSGKELDQFMAQRYE